MRELDVAKFAVAVTEAETVMFHRYEEIADLSDCADERVRMADALDDLLAAKVKRLKWHPRIVELQ
jgi:hypothetical protein